MFDAPVGRLILVICAAMRSARKRALSLTPVIGKLRRMNRIVERFGQLKKKGQKGFIVYIGAGDPNLETTRQLALAFDRARVDVLELGVPFSDPLADGRVNQLAAQRGLESGTTPPKVLGPSRPSARIRKLPSSYTSISTCSIATDLKDSSRTPRAPGWTACSCSTSRPRNRRITKP